MLSADIGRIDKEGGASVLCCKNSVSRFYLYSIVTKLFILGLTCVLYCFMAAKDGIKR